MTKEGLKEALNLGKIAQVGCVVRDLSRTIENYEKTIGIGPFITFTFRPEKTFIKGREPNIHLEIGIAQLTPELSLELIQIVSGEPYHKDFLETHGEGVQHLGFFTDDYDGVMTRAEGLEIPILMSAETDVSGMGHVRAAYLDTLELIGVLVEVIEVQPFE